MNADKTNSSPVSSIGPERFPTADISVGALAHLLIVDDETAHLKALCDTLAPEGYKTTAFSSARQALAALKDQTFDLVLSDLMMPEMDGITLLRAALEIDPKLVGIVMTGQGTIDTAVRAMQAGALDYILKPFKLSFILPVLARALAVRRLRMENIQLHEAVGIYKLSMAVASATGFDEVLQTVADAGLGQSQYRAVTILLPTEDGKELRVAVTRGEGAASEGTRIPFSSPLSGWVERSRELLGRADDLAGVHVLSTAPLPEMPSGICMPMLAGGKFVGILHFSSEQPVRPVASGHGKALNILASAGGSGLERASLMERLRSAEQRYRRLTENARDFVFRYEVHPHRRFSYVNPSVEAITGYPPEDHYADPDLCFKLVHPEDLRVMETVLSGGFPNGSAVMLRYVHRNGNQVWTEQRNMLVHDQHGRLIAIEGIARDITARRQLEEELRQAQKMEAIGRLAGGVAHDFNNLLTVINGYSEMLSSEPSLTHSMREEIGEVRKAGEQAAALTRQLLAFGRRQLVQPQVLNINTIVRNNVKILRRMIGEDIELLTSLDPDLGSVKADTGQIEQVLMNLVVNSRDAMPSGGKVTIETRNLSVHEIAAQPDLPSSGPQVTLAVTDTGSGMDRETQSRIFEPFFTTKESGRGTGLGLSIVYRVVEQSNGMIRVHSAPGLGTTFRIHLPRLDEGETLSDSAAAPLEVPGGSETILLVEDDATVRQFICTILGKGGYRVLSARDGNDALNMFRRLQRPPELVLTDLVMPRMSGAALVDALNQLSGGIRFLYISGYADDTVIRQGRIDPAIPFLQKPFTADSLLAKVRQALKGNAASAAGSTG